KVMKSMRIVAVFAVAIIVAWTDSSARAATIIGTSVYNSAFDNPPQDGIGDGIGAPRLGNLTGSVQFRTFAEYNISALTVPAASAIFIFPSAFIGQTLSLYGKIGDGVATATTDYALGALIGPLAFSGAFTADITSFLTSLIGINQWAELQIVWTGGPQTLFESFSAPIIQFDATPLPAALPLFATGLGALGLIGWRRKRQAAV